MKEKEEIKKDVDTAADEETQTAEETTEIPVEGEKTDLEKANEKIAETSICVRWLSSTTIVDVS